MQIDNRYSVLIWLLIGALLLSTGFNCYLVALQYKDVLPQGLATWHEEDAEEADDDDQSTMAEELRLTRTMLARCQADHLRTDSLRAQTNPDRLTTAASDLLVTSE
jgi:hypothetical protein